MADLLTGHSRQRVRGQRPSRMVLIRQSRILSLASEYEQGRSWATSRIKSKALAVGV